MATTPQSKFNVTLPTQDNTGAALAAGQITSLLFTVGTATYACPVASSASVPGAALAVPFSALTPAFVPVAGITYTADVQAVDAGGDGIPSASYSWTQAAAVPAACTNFSAA
jgi:hypothetical protein